MAVTWLLRCSSMGQGPWAGGMDGQPEPWGRVMLSLWVGFLFPWGSLCHAFEERAHWVILPVLVTLGILSIWKSTWTQSVGSVVKGVCHQYMMFDPWNLHDRMRDHSTGYPTSTCIRGTHMWKHTHSHIHTLTHIHSHTLNTQTHNNVCAT